MNGIVALVERNLSRSFPSRWLSTVTNPIFQGEVLFGKEPVRAAMKARKRKIFTLYLRKGKEKHLEQQARDAKVHIEYKEQGALNNIASKQLHQGVIADVGPKPAHLLQKLPKAPTAWKQRPPLWIVLDHVQDPRNLGAILRSCFFFGVDGVGISTKNSARLTPTVSKASVGTLEWMDVYGLRRSTHRVLLDAVDDGWCVVATIVPEATHQMKQIPLQRIEQPTVLVMGNEHRGVRPIVRDVCSHTISIPGRGSLNVSSATAVLLHRLLEYQ